MTKEVQNRPQSGHLEMAKSKKGRPRKNWKMTVTETPEDNGDGLGRGRTNSREQAGVAVLFPNVLEASGRTKN